MDGRGQRGLAVDVLAGVAGVDGLDGVEQRARDVDADLVVGAEVEPDRDRVWPAPYEHGADARCRSEDERLGIGPARARLNRPLFPVRLLETDVGDFRQKR